MEGKAKNKNASFEYTDPKTGKKVELPKETAMQLNLLLKKMFANYDSLTSDEERIKRYLTSLYHNIHIPNSDAVAFLTMKDEDYDWVRKFCENNKLVKKGRITEKGVAFLTMLNKKELLERQTKFNKLVTIFTIVMAIGVVAQAVILLIR